MKLQPSLQAAVQALGRGHLQFCFAFQGLPPLDTTLTGPDRPHPVRPAWRAQGNWVCTKHPWPMREPTMGVERVGGASSKDRIPKR